MIIPWRMRFMRLAVVMVAMPPQDQLFQDEESQDAKQYRSRHAMRIAMFQRMRQDFEESCAKQGADRVGDQHVDAVHAKSYTHARRRDDTQDAARQRYCNNPGKSAHGEPDAIRRKARIIRFPARSDLPSVRSSGHGDRKRSDQPR